VDRDDVSTVLAEALEAGAVAVQIFRRVPGRSGRHSFLATWPAGDVSLDELRDEFGGGDFWLKPTDERGRVMGGGTVTIDGPARGADAPRKRPRRGEDLEDEPAPPPGPAPGVAELLTAVVGMQRELKGVLQELRAPHPGYQGQNPAELFTSLIGAVDTMLKPYRDQLMAPRGDPDRDRMDDFLRGLELGRGLGAGGSGIGDIAARAFLPLMERLNANGGPMPTANPDPAAAAAAPPTVAPVHHDKLWARVVGPRLGELLSWAGAGLNPELRAELVLEEIPPVYYGAILAELERPRMFAEFLEGVPAAVPVRAWFERFFGSVRELLADEDEGDQEDEDLEDRPARSSRAARAPSSESAAELGGPGGPAGPADEDPAFRVDTDET
jgi:hypothetical protein